VFVRIYFSTLKWIQSNSIRFKNPERWYHWTELVVAHLSLFRNVESGVQKGRGTCTPPLRTYPHAISTFVLRTYLYGGYLSDRRWTSTRNSSGRKKHHTTPHHTRPPHCRQNVSRSTNRDPTTSRTTPHLVNMDVQKSRLVKVTRVLGRTGECPGSKNVG
jgi:hypothetical protein